MEPVAADKALFIKLGEGGRWELECLKGGTLRFGYQEISHALCAAGDWSEVERMAREFSKDKGSATRHVNQIRQFYEADEKTLWITFHSDRLWWCFSGREVFPLAGNEKERRVLGAWSDSDVNGEPLLKGKLSGRLLAVQGFQGTICTVSETGYLLHKINGTAEPHVALAQAAFDGLQAALVPIIRKLHPKDLEVLTDLVFSRFYFVTHSPSDSLRKEAEAVDDPGFIFWGADQLASQAVRGGLTGWLLDKAA